MDNAFSHAVSSTSGRRLKCQNMRVCHIRDVNAPNSDIAVCWCCILVNMLVKSPDKSFLTGNKAWATGDFFYCSLDPPMGLVEVCASWPRYPPMVNKKNHHENVKWRSRFICIPLIKLKMARALVLRVGCRRGPMTIAGLMVTMSMPFSFAYFHAASSAKVFESGYHSWIPNHKPHYAYYDPSYYNKIGFIGRQICLNVPIDCFTRPMYMYRL